MNWGEEDIPGRLTNRERAWRAKRSVRVLGADGIPPIMNPGGTSVMGQRGPVLAVASDFDPEVATWPEWKQRAFQVVVKDGVR